jgi:hypothetical protein
VFSPEYVECVNGVSCFPDPSTAQVALSTGERHFRLPPDMEIEDMEENQTRDMHALHIGKWNPRHVSDSGQIHVYTWK